MSQTQCPFRGTFQCEECGEPKEIYLRVATTEHQLDECPECGAEDVVYHRQGELETIA